MTPPPVPTSRKRSPWRWLLVLAPAILMLMGFLGASYFEKQRVASELLTLLAFALMGLSILASALFSYWLAEVTTKTKSARVVVTIIFTIILFIVSLLIAVSGCASVYPPNFH